MTPEEAKALEPWQRSIKRDDESEGAFLARKFTDLAEHPGFGFSIGDDVLEALGVSPAVLTAVPTPPSNVMLWLDPQTQNILAASLPKGMDVFGLLEKAKE